jgi:hypothetical protein
VIYWIKESPFQQQTGDFVHDGQAHNPNPPSSSKWKDPFFLRKVTRECETLKSSRFYHTMVTKRSTPTLLKELIIEVNQNQISTLDELNSTNGLVHINKKSTLSDLACAFVQCISLGDILSDAFAVHTHKKY